MSSNYVNFVTKYDIKGIIQTTTVQIHKNLPFNYYNNINLDVFNTKFTEHIASILCTKIPYDISWVVANFLIENRSQTLINILSEICDKYNPNLLKFMSVSRILPEYFDIISKELNINICLIAPPDIFKYAFATNFNLSLWRNYEYNKTLIIFNSSFLMMHNYSYDFHFDPIINHPYNPNFWPIEGPVQEFITNIDICDHTYDENSEYTLFYYNKRSILPVNPSFVDFMNLYLYYNEITYKPRYEKYVLNDFVLDCIIVAYSKSGTIFIIYEDYYCGFNYRLTGYTLILHLSINGVFTMSDYSASEMAAKYKKMSLKRFKQMDITLF